MSKKITELRGIKSDVAQHASPYLMDLLKKYGFKPIGHGSRSKVYKKSDDFVIKIFNQTDQAYKDWVLLSVKNRDNPHFPRIIGKPVKIGEEYYAIRLEPLWLLEPNNKYFGTIKSLYGILERPNWKTILDTRPDFKEMFEEFPQLESAIILLKKFESAHPDYELDVGTYNTMLRGKVPVITDPFFI